MLRRVLSVFFLLFSTEAFAQFHADLVIKGVVRDSVTGRPIESVNVFLASTSTGTGSDRNGNYALTHLSRGRSMLIFSRVGYGLKAIPIETLRADTLIKDATLAPRLISLGDVEVSSEAARAWHRNYEKFSRILLGEGPNAAECEITNPDVLTFHADSTSDVLEASASRPLRITNKGLGYRLDISLSEFHWNTESDYGYFLLYSLFHPLIPSDSREGERWNERRQTAYEGSLAHFLRSLIQRRVNEEGFVVRRRGLQVGSGMDRYVYPEEIKVEPVPGSALWRWTFDEWLKVNRENESSMRASSIQIDHDGMLIDRNGIVENPLSFKLRGRWAKERISEMLPLDALRHPFDVHETTPLQGEDALHDSITALLARKEWSEASGICKDLLQRNPGDLFARYAAGISRRELGHFNEAREYFKALEKIDSTYGDVFYQHALTEDYDDHLPLATELGLRQLHLHPNDASPFLGVFHIFRHFIAVTEPAKALPWLESIDDPYARFFLAELHRRRGRFTLAEELDRAVQKENIVPLQATTVALAELHVAQGDDAQAQEVYWKGVENITNEVDAGCIFDNVKSIATNDEVNEYAAIASNRDWKAFIHRFWNRRNPMPASSENPRLVEHLRRSVAVEGHYEYFGNRHWHQNVDQLVGPVLLKEFTLNTELNDQGMIYMRHGEPTTVLRCRGVSEGDFDPQQDASFNAGATISDHMVHASQTWFYAGDANTPRYVFFFICWNGATNYWAFSTTPPPDPDLMSSLRTLAPDFATYDRLPQSQAALELKEQEMISDGLRSDNQSWEKKTSIINIPHSIESFRAESVGTLLDISYAIPLAELAKYVVQQQAPVAVEVGLSIQSVSGDPLVSRLDTLSLPPAAELKGSYLSLYRYTMQPRPVRVAMHARTLDDHVVGTWSKELAVKDYSSGEFSASDLQLLLPASGALSIAIEGEKVTQSPFQIYRRNAKVFGYVKLYNLVKDGDGNVKYSVRFTLMPDGTDDPADAIELGRITRQKVEQEESAFEQLDLKSVAPGRYRLRAELSDRLRVQTIVREREIEVIR